MVEPNRMAGAFSASPSSSRGLLQVEPEAEASVSVLELQDVQDKPALFITFMMWMLAGLYHELPEVGDIDKQARVFFTRRTCCSRGEQGVPDSRSSRSCG